MTSHDALDRDTCYHDCPRKGASGITGLGSPYCTILHNVGTSAESHVGLAIGGHSTAGQSIAKSVPYYTQGQLYFYSSCLYSWESRFVDNRGMEKDHSLKCYALLLRYACPSLSAHLGGVFTATPPNELPTKSWCY